jgi:predicted RNA-binding protein Jag
VQLLLHLLATRTADEPVPVLLPVAGWDTRRHEYLQEWIADRLTSDYPALC